MKSSFGRTCYSYPSYICKHIVYTKLVYTMLDYKQ